MRSLFAILCPQQSTLNCVRIQALQAMIAYAFAPAVKGVSLPRLVTPARTLHSQASFQPRYACCRIFLTCVTLDLSDMILGGACDVTLRVGAHHSLMRYILTIAQSGVMRLVISLDSYLGFIVPDDRLPMLCQAARTTEPTCVC